MTPVLLLNAGVMSKPTRPDTEDKARNVDVRRPDGQWARMAQLLLVVRLRARNRRDLAADSLERAAQVILVTCKNWFSPSRDRASRPETPAPQAATPSPKGDNKDNPQGPDAHRHD